MVYQPVDFGRQLHIALNAHVRLVATQSFVEDGQRRSLGQCQRQVRPDVCRGQIQQACWRDHQLQRKCAPFHGSDTPLLPLQASQRLRFLLQDMVEQQHDALLRFTHHPLRRRKTGCELIENVLNKYKRRLCCHNLLLLRVSRRLLQGLHPSHQPTAAGFGFGHVPHLTEGVGPGGRLLADQA